MSKPKKEPTLQEQLSHEEKIIAAHQNKKEALAKRIRNEQEVNEESAGTLEQRVIAFLNHRGHHFKAPSEISVKELGNTTVIKINVDGRAYEGNDAVKAITERVGEDAIRKNEVEKGTYRKQVGENREWDPDARSITDSLGDYRITPAYADIDYARHTLTVNTQALKNAFNMVELEGKQGGR